MHPACGCEWAVKEEGNLTVRLQPCIHSPCQLALRDTRGTRGSSSFLLNTSLHAERFRDPVSARTCASLSFSPKPMCLICWPLYVRNNCQWALPARTVIPVVLAF